MSETLATVRDIAVIVLAVLAIVWVVLLLVLTVVLINVVNKHVRPLLDTATGTARHVQATTAMVTEMTVSPIIRFAGFAAGAKAMAETLTRRGKAKGDKV